MNITGLSGRINGVRLYGTKQVGILECGRWPYERSFLIRKCMGVSPGQKKVAVITR